MVITVNIYFYCYLLLVLVEMSFYLMTNDIVNNQNDSIKGVKCARRSDYFLETCIYIHEIPLELG